VPRYRFSDFTLSTRQRLLIRNGQQLPLTPRYLDLLIFLIGRRRDAVHRREIFDRVWSDVIVSDSALSQAIRTLRPDPGRRFTRAAVHPHRLTPRLPVHVSRHHRGTGTRWLSTTSSDRYRRRQPNADRHDADSGADSTMNIAWRVTERDRPPMDRRVVCGSQRHSPHKQSRVSYHFICRPILGIRPCTTDDGRI
jgi:Transcriptional regulatory protein, C terminal